MNIYQAQYVNQQNIFIVAENEKEAQTQAQALFPDLKIKYLIERDMDFFNNKGHYPKELETRSSLAYFKENDKDDFIKDFKLLIDLYNTFFPRISIIDNYLLSEMEKPEGEESFTDEHFELVRKYQSRYPGKDVILKREFERLRTVAHMIAAKRYTEERGSPENPYMQQWLKAAEVWFEKEGRKPTFAKFKTEKHLFTF